MNGGQRGRCSGGEEKGTDHILFRRSYSRLLRRYVSQQPGWRCGPKINRTKQTESSVAISLYLCANIESHRADASHSETGRTVAIHLDHLALRFDDISVRPGGQACVPACGPILAVAVDGNEADVATAEGNSIATFCIEIVITLPACCVAEGNHG
jgi:hypothetical protein